jgi:hypothetical protein
MARTPRPFFLRASTSSRLSARVPGLPNLTPLSRAAPRPQVTRSLMI